MAAISVIICTYRRAVAIERLLAALREQTALPDEIVIVDASSDLQTERAVESRQDRWPPGCVKYFRVSEEHRGLTRQRNFGVGRASGDLIVFLDDDTIPAPTYLEETRACFDRHPNAAGVGGFITDTEWRRASTDREPRVGTFHANGWERREHYRWRLRRVFGLSSPAPPGWMPPAGYGRPIDFVPPDGEDHRVEFMMGGASAWRRDVFLRHAFSPRFEGYGLYEDLDFSVRVSRERPLVVCTRAKIAHYHDPAGRPHSFRYGRMVVENGWYVWRLRWPNPGIRDRTRWWAVTVLLAVCRLLDCRAPKRSSGLVEALGRFSGMVRIIFP